MYGNMEAGVSHLVGDADILDWPAFCQKLVASEKAGPPPPEPNPAPEPEPKPKVEK